MANREHVKLVLGSRDEFIQWQRSHGDVLDLTGAKLAGAKLAGADLSGADLSGAKLTGAKPVEW